MTFAAISPPRRRSLWAAFAFAAVAATASADYIRYGTAYDYTYTYAPERLSREHRDGAELDDWIERGNATVTLSPAFEKGIRVAAWANDYNTPEEYDFGLASAIYQFDVPYQARQLNIRIRYEGDGRADEFGQEPIAGRVWIRTEHRTPDNPDRAIGGDTFVLRANKRSETLKIPAARYVSPRGQIELHIVADGRNRIDIAYIDVESFSREEEIRVVRRWVPEYRWRPWTAYTYHVFYGGPFYYPTDYGHYLMWDFPYGDVGFVTVRSYYRDYIYTHYHRRYPHRRVYVNCYYDPAYRTERVRYVSRWTPELNRVRDQYERGRTSADKTRTAPDEALALRRSVNTTIQSYERSPAASEFMNRSAAKSRRGAVEESARAIPYRTFDAPRSGDDLAKTRRSAPSYEYDTRRSAPSYQRTLPAPSSPSVTDELEKRRRAPVYEEPSRRTYNRSDEEEEQRRRAAAASAEKSRRDSGSSSKASSAPSSGSSSSKSDDDEKKRRR